MSRCIRMAVSVLLVLLLCFGTCGCMPLFGVLQIADTYSLNTPGGTHQADGSILMDDGTLYRSFTLPNDIKVLKGYPKYYHFEGRFYDGTKDGTLLYDSINDELYCREDYRNELSSLVANESLFTDYCLTKDLYTDTTYLTDEEIKAVQETLKEKPITVDSYLVHTWIDIHKANADHTFSKDTGITIGYDGDMYYLYDPGRDETAIYRYSIPFHAYSTIHDLYQRHPLAFEQNNEDTPVA